MTQHPIPDGIVTLRELYTLIEKTRSDLLLDLQKVSTGVDQKFTEHVLEHKHEKRQRDGLIRWAVTTLITTAGVMVAIYVAAKGG